MTEAPKRIWAWPDKGNPESVTGRWSCNTYSSDLTQSYILATEHERMMVERDAEVGSWRMVAEMNGATARTHCEQVAEREVEIARLRETLTAIRRHSTLAADIVRRNYLRQPEKCDDARSINVEIAAIARAALGDDND